MKRLLPLSLLLVSCQLYAGPPLRMDIAKVQDQIVVDWQGGSGIYQLQSRPDAARGAWRAVGWPTRQTQAIVSSGLQSASRQPRAVYRIADRTTHDLLLAESAQNLIAEGQRVFRYETFGDEDFWGGALKLHWAIAGTNHGGVGPGVSPKMALAVGLKVDAEALPAELVAQIEAGRVYLDNPATTLALLQLNAVVGMTGFFTNGALQSIGLQCAFCHSTVDDSVAPGIGRRLDGWPNRDLNVGAIVALSPDLSAITSVLQVNEATVRQVLASWGPGKFDAQLLLDGKGYREDGKTAATLLPPAFGLAGVNLNTSTGWGSLTYWNAFVANIEMHGKGNFFDPRLNNTNQFPVAARNGFGQISRAETEDLISSKLPALHVYQLSIPAPKPPDGTYNKEAAQRGDPLFAGKARCATCHVPPVYTEPGWQLHTAAEIGVDDFQANRSPDRRYRTAPLRGLFAHQKGGFYHDGRFATLADVVNHYDSHLKTGLTDAEKADLVEYLKSL